MFFNMFSAKYQESVFAAKQDVEGATRAKLMSLRENPHNRDSLYAIGSLFACQGKWWEASYYLEQDVILSPDDAGLLNDLSNCYWNQGAFEKCLEILRRLLTLEPTSWLTLDKLSVVSRELGRRDDAVFYGEEAVRRGGFRFGESLTNLARAYLAVRRYDDAIPLLNRALREDPDNGDYKNLLARAHDGDRSGLGSSFNLTPHLDAADRLEAEGKYEQAIDELRSGLCLDPRSGAVLRKLARLFFLTKQFPECISSFIHAEARGVSLSADDLCLVGRAYASISFHHKALESYDRSLILAENADTHVARGDSYRKLQDFDNAERCFERALVLNPHHCDALCGLAAACAERGAFPRALLAYEQWIGVQRQYASTKHSAAVVLLRNGEHEKALELIADLQRLDPRDSELFFLEGCACAGQSRNGDAIAALETCLALNTHHSLALCLLLTLK